MDENKYIAAAELGLQPIHLACLEGDLEEVIKLAREPKAIDALTEPPARAEWRYRETPMYVIPNDLFTDPSIHLPALPFIHLSQKRHQ